MGLFSSAKPKEPEEKDTKKLPLPTPLADALAKRIDQTRLEREVCSIHLCVLSAKHYFRLCSELRPWYVHEGINGRETYKWQISIDGWIYNLGTLVRCGCGACEDSIKTPVGRPGRVDLSLDDLGV